jgi:hypothetical protein
MPGQIEYKDFIAEVKESSEADLTVVHFISTETPDRGEDIMRANGMTIEGRVVVLHSHGFGPMGSEPIAKPLWIQSGKFKGKKGIQAKTQYFPDEVGKRLWKKAVEGYMPNWSVGYIIDEYKEINQGRGRDILKWRLLEYSQVGVPMNPEASTVEKQQGNICFKVISPGVEIKHCGKCGPETCDCEDSDPFEIKPYPSEHACRINEPDQYKRIRRQNDKFGKGIDAIWGIKDDDSVELQALRFSKDKFTADEARAWCKSHDYTCKPFEPASEKDEEDIENKEVNHALEFLQAEIEDLKEALSEIKTTLSNLSAQPGAEKKEELGGPPDPPTKKIVVVTTTKDQEMARAEMSAQVSFQITEIIKKTIPQVVREEFDRLRGKVN